MYVALSRPVALEELKRRAAKVGRPVTSFAPRVLFVLNVYLERVLDLTQARVRTDWDITLEDLRTDDVYDRCQEVALVARHEGYEAIRFPSATGHGENLAIFYDRIRVASYVLLVTEEPVDLERI